MITILENSDLFESRADALVNPVNCKGVMGKGIALEFKKRFPEIVQPYENACNSGRLRPGRLLYVPLFGQQDLFVSYTKGIVLFPTKDHWKNPSLIEYISSGLVDLKRNHKKWKLTSIAMPQIGCGLGGLKWEDVQPLVEKYFKTAGIEIEVYLSTTLVYGEK